MKQKVIIGVLSLGLLASSYGAYDYYIGGRCNPKGTCNACKNCKYCKNCSQRGGSCSVCR